MPRSQTKFLAHRRFICPREMEGRDKRKRKLGKKTKRRDNKRDNGEGEEIFVPEWVKEQSLYKEKTDVTYRQTEVYKDTRGHLVLE